MVQTRIKAPDKIGSEKIKECKHSVAHSWCQLIPLRHMFVDQFRIFVACFRMFVARFRREIPLSTCQWLEDLGSGTHCHAEYAGNWMTLQFRKHYFCTQSQIFGLAAWIVRWVWIWRGFEAGADSQAEQSSRVIRTRSTEVAPTQIFKERFKSSSIFLVREWDRGSLASSFSCGWFRLQVGFLKSDTFQNKIKTNS